MNKRKYFSGILFVYTFWTCVLSHDPLQGISLDEKKSVPKRSATVQKKVGLNSTFFLNRFDQFCSAHVNKWTVHVSKIFKENNRNRSEPYRTVKKNRSGYSPFIWLFERNGMMMGWNEHGMFTKRQNLIGWLIRLRNSDDILDYGKNEHFRNSVIKKKQKIYIWRILKWKKMKKVSFTNSFYF